MQEMTTVQQELITVQASTSCEKNWTQFNSHCYLFVPKRQSWFDALKTCNSKDSYLAEMTSKSELKFVADLVHGSLLGRNVIIWIGATDTQPGYKGTFVYQVSKHAVPQEFWADGNPNNHEDYNCVIMFVNKEHSKFKNNLCAGA